MRRIGFVGSGSVNPTAIAVVLEEVGRLSTGDRRHQEKVNK
jgi:hypothetical protein